MNSRKQILGSLIGLGVCGLLGWLLIPFDLALSQNLAPSSKPAPDLAAGKAAYQDNCARCHGPTGAGDGMDAKRMVPMPRKLYEGIFKFRTTASGTPPTDEDLFRTISTGLPGSRMPDFQRLPEEIRWQLVAYVKSLSTVFQEQKPEGVDLGVDPGPAKADLKKGKEVYTQLGCAACHGPQGRGNGPSAPTLVDNWGRPIRAADLTHAWSYRAGSAPTDIMARLMTGIDGTPMPSYADAIPSKQEAWALAYYVQSIQETPRWNRTIEAVKASGALPMAPEDPGWAKAPRTDLRLSSNYYRQGEILPTTVTAISVQALYNEETILFRLTWHDPSENRQAPPDAAALVLVPDRKLKTLVGSLRSWPATAEAPALDLGYWPANEPDKAFFTNTRGFGFTETHAVIDMESIPLESKASYTEGRWTVMIKQPLKHLQREGAIPKKSILIGIAVWDGGNGEQGRRRANSNWIDLVLE